MFLLHTSMNIRLILLKVSVKTYKLILFTLITFFRAPASDFSQNFPQYFTQPPFFHPHYKFPKFINFSDSSILSLPIHISQPDPTFNYTKVQSLHQQQCLVHYPHSMLSHVLKAVLDIPTPFFQYPPYI